MSTHGPVSDIPVYLALSETVPGNVLLAQHFEVAP